MKKTPLMLLLALATSSAQGTQVGSNVYNPALGLILNGTYANYSQDPSSYSLSGFPLVGDPGLVPSGFALGESELDLSSNIDNLYYGQMAASLAPNGGMNVEEAYIRTLALGGGVNLKFGRFKSNIGYLNSQHAHKWDFADAPLAYRGMLGGTYSDDGVQFSWLPPTDLYMELSAEAMRGDGYPAAGAVNDGQGAVTAAIHFGGDVGASNSWTAGYSQLSARAQNRGEQGANGFTGNSTVSIVDLVWKWAPNGNPLEHNLVFQTEYLKRDENGTYDAGAPGSYLGRQSGWYAQVAYQFMPRWRFGLRYDALESNNSGAGVAGTQLDSGGHKPTRSSVMVDFANSEFSRLRLQYNDDHSSAVADRQLMLQYIMSLGAHGAHQF